jgi:lactate dehydrogenase-like 2-hydroxyacid dehydrogenase
LQLVGRRLDGKKLGIYGFGKIGQALAQRARGFEMEIHYYDIMRQPPEKEQGAIFHDSLDSLLAISEFFSINAPSTPETRYFFNKETIEKLPHGAIVVNSARGDLVKDEDLIAALKSGRLAASGKRCDRGAQSDGLRGTRQRGRSVCRQGDALQVDVRHCAAGINKGPDTSAGSFSAF